MADLPDGPRGCRRPIHLLSSELLKALPCRIVEAEFLERIRQSQSIFDGHRPALSEVLSGRVCRIADQPNASRGPLRERFQVTDIRSQDALHSSIR